MSNTATAPVKRTFLFHTFTTGMWQFKAGFPDKEQPMLVGIGCCTISEEEEEIDRLIDLIALPRGHHVPAKTSEYHGIYDRDVAEMGKPPADVLARVLTMMEGCHYAASYGADVHNGILRVAIWRARLESQRLEPIDLMKRLTNVCKIIDRTGNYKWPKMTEAYEFFRREPMIINPDLGPLGVIGSALDAALVCYQGLRRHEAKALAAAAAPIGDVSDRDLIP